MGSTYKELKTDMQLLTAAILRVFVTVVEQDPFAEDQVIELGGIVEAYTPQRVMVNGLWFFRKGYSFRITE